MSKDNKEKKDNKQKSPSEVKKKIKRSSRPSKRKRSSRSKRSRNREDQGYDKQIINIRRVTRVYKGGKRMRLSVFMAVGDKKGKVGLGVGKGPDVRTAEQKAYKRAVKNMSMVPLKGVTIPHRIDHTYKASKIILRPAAPGTGIIAGAPARAVLELAGVKDVLTKRIGTSNAISIAYATLDALKSLKSTRL